MSKRSRPVGANRSLRAAPPAKKIKVSAREEQPPPKRNFLDEDQDDDNDALDLSSSEDAGSEDEEVMTFDRVTPGEDELDAESSEEEKLEGEADLEEDDDDDEEEEDEDEDDDDEEEAEEGQQETEIKEEKQEDTPSDTTTTTTKTKSRQKAVFFVGGETSEPSDGRISQSIIDTSVSFASFNLDSRILKAIIKMGYQNPTLVQSSSIPLALEGKDILARARTGSGKTAAYLIPVLQILLQLQEDSSASSSSSVDLTSSAASSSSSSSSSTNLGTKAVILVPTHELVNQTKTVLQQLTRFCPQITSVALLRTIPAQLQKQKLAELPDIVISTPSQLLPHLQKKNLVLSESLRALVLDEADLLLNYGYADEIKQILPDIPPYCQKFMMSATLPEELEELKRLVLNNPAILRLEEASETKEALTQHSIRCSAADRYLILYAILKLNLIKGKCLIFTNTTDNCFRLKLFLERFFISAAVLNSELPLNSRLDIIKQFNTGKFDYLIATDDSSLYHEDLPAKDKKGPKKDKEFGVSRGVDFKGVKAVINFDIPENPQNYVHRIGRTARGGATGVAVTFVTPDEWDLLDSIEESVGELGYEIKPYAFNLTAIQKFRYRVEDMLRSVTRVAVRDARLKELKTELLNSDKLESHFEENPRDFELVQHDRPLQRKRQNPVLKFLPTYLLPGTSSTIDQLSNDVAPHTFRKTTFRDDPLRTFRFDSTSQIDIPVVGTKEKTGGRRHGKKKFGKKRK